MKNPYYYLSLLNLGSKFIIIEHMPGACLLFIIVLNINIMEC